MTDIATLGEFGLIDHLTRDIKPRQKSTIRGVGDDCAVLHYPDKEVLVTTDLLMEGVHFDLTYIDLQHLGYKAAMVNLSDVFAMNGQPRQLTVSLALSKRFTVEDMEQFYSGLRLACDKYDVDIVGGDTTSSYTGLAISITCIGEGEPGRIVYRDGAKNTDLVCVTGDLGAARGEVLAAQRVLGEEIDVVGDDHQVAYAEVGVHAAGGVAHEERLDAQLVHHAYGERHLLHRVSLVVVEAPLHGHDVLAAELAEDELAGVALHGRYGEVGYVLVGELVGVSDFGS